MRADRRMAKPSASMYRMTNVDKEHLYSMVSDTDEVKGATVESMEEEVVVREEEVVNDPLVLHVR